MAIIINSAYDARQFQKEKEEARKHINSNWDALRYYETFGGNGFAGNWGSPTRYTGEFTYVYNPRTRKWTKQATYHFNTKSFDFSFDSKSFSSGLGGGSFTGGSSGAISQAGVVNSNNNAATSSKTDAEKEYIDIEFNTLTGEITVLPTPSNMKLKVGDTITLQGVGQFLSGLYFISEIKRTISNDNAYSMSLILFKNGFGDSLKSSFDSSSTTTNIVNSGRPAEKDITNNSVLSSLKVGDKVRIVGDDATYANAYDGVKVPEWVKQEILTVDYITEDRTRVRLNPIWSWTYLKYVQLV